MATDFTSMEYKVFKDYNIIFDEKGSTCGTVRLVQWVKEGSEPDESKAKLEIRKIYTNAEGEKVGKGYAFSTPEGPSELVHGLIEAGYGDTKEILRKVRARDNFLEAAKTINEDDDGNDSGEMFDIRSLFSEEGELDDAADI